MPQATWRERLAKVRGAVRFAPPATEPALADVEHALGVALPEELRALLLESDGVVDRHGTSIVWSAAEITRRNNEFRTNAEFRQLYMPFDALLFFGEAGDGDQFFYRVLDGAVRLPDIYVWAHETDSRVWRASGLEAFLPAVLAG